MNAPVSNSELYPGRRRVRRTNRNDVRDNLVNFACAIDVPGRPMSADPDEWLFAKVETTLAPHHRLLLEKIEQVVNKPYGRAMILMPPGSAKSTYCSVVLPTFLMGRVPGYRIILASYGTDLARKHGRRARQIVRSARYNKIFGTTLSREQSAADAWALTNGSEYMATGIQAAVTGNRANGIIIDDPVKGRDEAELGKHPRQDPRRLRGRPQDPAHSGRLDHPDPDPLARGRPRRLDPARGLGRRERPDPLPRRRHLGRDLPAGEVRPRRRSARPQDRRLSLARVVRPQALAGLRARSPHLVGALSAKAGARDRQRVRGRLAQDL